MSDTGPMVLWLCYCFYHCCYIQNDLCTKSLLVNVQIWYEMTWVRMEVGTKRLKKHQIGPLVVQMFYKV